MKPHEILHKIITERGSCDWVTDFDKSCAMCPIGRKGSCIKLVSDKKGSHKDRDYLEVAKEMLADLEVSRIILGEDIDT